MITFLRPGPKAIGFIVTALVIIIVVAVLASIPAVGNVFSAPLCSVPNSISQTSDASCSYFLQTEVAASKLTLTPQPTGQ